jgi:uncharacterized protein (TIGR04255 family)
VARLRFQPLVYVVAQVGFTPVLTLREHLATIQGGFRSLGFPRYQQGQVANIVLAAGGSPSITTSPRWEFLDREKRTGIALTEGALSLATNQYTTYEPFADLVRSALSVIAEFAKGALTERIGLRYIDSVRPGVSESVEDYVIPELLGFSFPNVPVQPGGTRSFRTDSVAKTTSGTLTVRCYQLTPPQFLPPDLWPSSLSFPPDVSATPSVTLDFDHMTDRTIDYHVDQIVEVLGELHDALGSAFHQAITPHAWARWEPIEQEA